MQMVQPPPLTVHILGKIMSHFEYISGDGLQCSICEDAYDKEKADKVFSNFMGMMVEEEEKDTETKSKKTKNVFLSDEDVSEDEENEFTKPHPQSWYTVKDEKGMFTDSDLSEDYKADDKVKDVVEDPVKDETDEDNIDLAQEWEASPMNQSDEENNDTLLMKKKHQDHSILSEEEEYNSIMKMKAKSENGMTLGELLAKNKKDAESSITLQAAFQDAKKEYDKKHASKNYAFDDISIGGYLDDLSDHMSDEEEDDSVSEDEYTGTDLEIHFDMYADKAYELNGLGDLEADKRYIRTSEGHVYRLSCMREWLVVGKNATCPKTGKTLKMT
jgi:hypothetical protein